MPSLIDLGDININSVNRYSITVKKDGAAWDITGGAVTFTFHPPSAGTLLNRSATILTPASGLCYYDSVTTDITVAGNWAISIRVVVGSIDLTYPGAIKFRAVDRGS